MKKSHLLRHIWTYTVSNNLFRGSFRVSQAIFWKTTRTFILKTSL